MRKSLQAHDQVNSLVTAVRNFENKFAEALLHEHSAHMAAANSHTPQGSLSPGGRNTTILTSSSFGAQKNAAAATPASASASACGVAAGESEEERRARLDERALLLGNTLRSYVAAEAQCIQFLSERVVAAETKLLTLRKELLAYAALSMKVSLLFVFILKFFVRCLFRRNQM